MSTNTIDVRVQVGPRTYTFALVADPGDAMIALQVGRKVSEILLEHKEES